MGNHVLRNQGDENNISLESYHLRKRKIESEDYISYIHKILSLVIEIPSRCNIKIILPIYLTPIICRALC